MTEDDIEFDDLFNDNSDGDAGYTEIDGDATASPDDGSISDEEIAVGAESRWNGSAYYEIVYDDGFGPTVIDDWYATIDDLKAIMREHNTSEVHAAHGMFRSSLDKAAADLGIIYHDLTILLSRATFLANVPLRRQNNEKTTYGAMGLNPYVTEIADVRRKVRECMDSINSIDEHEMLGLLDGVMSHVVDIEESQNAGVYGAYDQLSTLIKRYHKPAPSKKSVGMRQAYLIDMTRQQLDTDVKTALANLYGSYRD